MDIYDEPLSVRDTLAVLQKVQSLQREKRWIHKLLAPIAVRWSPFRSTEMRWTRWSAKFAAKRSCHISTVRILAHLRATSSRRGCCTLIIGEPSMLFALNTLWRRTPLLPTVSHAPSVPLCALSLVFLTLLLFAWRWSLKAYAGGCCHSV